MFESDRHVESVINATLKSRPPGGSSFSQRVPAYIFLLSSFIFIRFDLHALHTRLCLDQCSTLHFDGLQRARCVTCQRHWVDPGVLQRAQTSNSQSSFIHLSFAFLIKYSM